MINLSPQKLYRLKNFLNNINVLNKFLYEAIFIQYGVDVLPYEIIR